MPGLRDRLLTPAGARAVTSPVAVVGAALAASVGIVAGAAPIAAGVLGAAAYAGLVALRLPRSPAPAPIRPGDVPEPWRRYVLEALDAEARFGRAVSRAPLGPLRERLEQIGDRVGQGVRECWRIARHGAALDEALQQLEPITRVQERLDRVEADLSGARAGDDRLAQMAASLRAQLDSTRRIARVARDARERLQLLDARLDEAVARAIELSLSAGDPAALGGLTSDVDAIVGEMESLRLALEEASATPGPRATA